VRMREVGHHSAMTRDLPSLFVPTEQSIRDPARYQHRRPAYLSDVKSGAGRRIDRRSCTPPSHPETSHPEWRQRYEISSDEVPGRAWDRKCAGHVGNERVVRAAEFQLHSPLRQLGRANGALLLKATANRLLARWSAHAANRERGPASGRAPFDVNRAVGHAHQRRDYSIPAKGPFAACPVIKIGV